MVSGGDDLESRPAPPVSRGLRTLRERKLRTRQAIGKSGSLRSIGLDAGLYFLDGCVDMVDRVDLVAVKIAGRLMIENLLRFFQPFDRRMHRRKAIFPLALELTRRLCERNRRQRKRDRLT